MYLAVKDTNTTQISASGSFPLGECYDSARPSEDEAGKAHRSLRQVSILQSSIWIVAPSNCPKFHT